MAEDLQAVVHPAGDGLDDLACENRVLTQQPQRDRRVAKRIDEALEPLFRSCSGQLPGLACQVELQDHGAIEQEHERQRQVDRQETAGGRRIERRRGKTFHELTQAGGQVGIGRIEERADGREEVGLAAVAEELGREGEWRGRWRRPGAFQLDEPRRARRHPGHPGSDGLLRLAQEDTEVVHPDPLLREATLEEAVLTEGVLRLPPGEATRGAIGVLRRLREPAGSSPTGSPFAQRERSRPAGERKAVELGQGGLLKPDTLSRLRLNLLRREAP